MVWIYVLSGMGQTVYCFGSRTQFLHILETEKGCFDVSNDCGCACIWDMVFFCPDDGSIYVCGGVFALSWICVQAGEKKAVLRCAGFGSIYVTDMLQYVVVSLGKDLPQRGYNAAHTRCCHVDLFWVSGLCYME